MQGQGMLTRSFTLSCTYFDLNTSQPLQQIRTGEDSVRNEAFVLLRPSESVYNSHGYQYRIHRRDETSLRRD